ncbi:hypothetical protein [Thermocatellispora tengchongensis]|uniref:hypothetical protein n=1 Tax=Thermocatellispora tengchongensis TaxID=1073253 RepID=UPI003642D894
MAFSKSAITSLYAFAESSPSPHITKLSVVFDCAAPPPPTAHPASTSGTAASATAVMRLSRFPIPNSSSPRARRPARRRRMGQSS